MSAPNMAAKLSATSALLHARQVAFGIEEPGAVGDADQRAGIVEYVDHQKTKHDDDESQLCGTGEIELQKGRRKRRRQRHDARELGEPERYADQRHGKDANQRGAGDVAVIERNDHDEAREAEDRRPLPEIAERDQRRWICDDDLGLLERDDAEKEPDSGGDRQFEILGDRVDDVFADPEDRNQEEDDPGAEHGGERLLPAVFVAEHYRERKEGIEPHARRERDGIIGIERHHQGRDRGGDAGRDEHRALIHARVTKNLRVHEHDVDHGQERRDAGDELGADIAAALAQAKIAIEKCSLVRRLYCVAHVRSPVRSTAPRSDLHVRMPTKAGA